MQIALDKDGRRIHISKAERGGDYFCPGCGAKMMVKKGEIKIHHFAHMPSSVCTDHWHYDMSEWHYGWQSRFPESTQEIVKEKDGKRHRADVLLEDKKIIIEFQHSPLNEKEFDERNAFYMSLGYKVVWLFDVIDDFENSMERTIKNDSVIHWSRPMPALRGFDPKNSDVELYFQVLEDNHDPDDPDPLVIFKVEWAAHGFSYFVDDQWFSIGEFIDLFLQRSKDPERLKITGIYDELPKVRQQDHTSYFFGCPLAPSHLAISWEFDVQDAKYRSCSTCKHNEWCGQDSTACRKRIDDLNLPKEAKIVNCEKVGGQVRKIVYEVDGVVKSVTLPEARYQSDEIDSIMNLWAKNNIRKGIFRNMKTGWYAEIYGDPSAMMTKYHNVYGKVSKDPYKFWGDSCIIKYPQSKCWILFRKWGR